MPQYTNDSISPSNTLAQQMAQHWEHNKNVVLGQPAQTYGVTLGSESAATYNNAASLLSNAGVLKK